MNPYQQQGFGLFVALLAGALLVGGWLAVSDPALAHSLLGSRSGADWLLLAGMLAAALAMVGLGATLWAAGAQLFATLVKLAAVAVFVLLVIALVAPAGNPGASSALNSLQDLVERFSQRGPSPAATPAVPATAPPTQSSSTPSPAPTSNPPAPVTWWQTP